MENGFDDFFQDDHVPGLSLRRRIDARMDELRLGGCNSYEFLKLSQSMGNMVL